MGVLKELFENKRLPKEPITFEATKKYDCENYTIESVEVKGEIKYRVQPIPKKEEKQKQQEQQETPTKAKEKSFREYLTQGGKLQGIDSKGAIRNRMDRQQAQIGVLNDWTKTKGYLKYKKKTSENIR